MHGILTNFKIHCRKLCVLLFVVLISIANSVSSLPSCRMAYSAPRSPFQSITTDPKSRIFYTCMYMYKIFNKKRLEYAYAYPFSLDDAYLNPNITFRFLYSNVHYGQTTLFIYFFFFSKRLIKFCLFSKSTHRNWNRMNLRSSVINMNDNENNILFFYYHYYIVIIYYIYIFFFL